MKTVLRMLCFAALAAFAANASLHANNWVAGSGDYNLPANWLEGAVPGATDAASISNGGTANLVGSNSAWYLAVDNGTLNFNSGGQLTLDVAYAGAALGGSGGETGMLNLNTGGTLITPAVSLTGNPGTGVVNFNGGTLQASLGTSAAHTLLLQDTTNLVGSNGGTINVPSGIYIDVTSPLLAAAGSTGGVTKSGSGYLYFTGAASNTYAGTTTISGGNMVLNKAAAVSIPANLNWAGTGWVWVAGNGQIAGTSVLNFTAGGTNPIRNLIFRGTTEQTVAGLIANPTGSVTPKIAGYASTLGGLPVPSAGDQLRFTINTPAGANYSYKGTFMDNNEGFLGLPVFTIIKDGSGTQVLIDLSSLNSIGGRISGGLEVKDGVLDCTQATLPDSQDFTDLTRNSGHYTITGGTLSIGSQNAGTVLVSGRMRGIGKFQITGGTVEANTSTPGTLYSNYDFDIQGGTVNAILAATGHLQGSSTPYSQGLTKTEDTLATLGAANTYTGPTTISEGTLALAEHGQISTASAISTATGATFEIRAGTHTVGTITGSGTTQVDDSATLTATSIVQNSLVIGGTAVAVNAVPEPSTWVLLVIGAWGFVLAAYRRR
jgi:autotransporter-associated beta strand protein